MSYATWPHYFLKPSYQLSVSEFGIEAKGNSDLGLLLVQRSNDVRRE